MEQTFKKVLAFICLSFISTSAWSQLSSHKASPEELKTAQEKNDRYARRPVLRSAYGVNDLSQPVSETAHIRYLLIAGTSESAPLDNFRQILAQNLPNEVILIAVTENSGAKAAKDFFGRYLSKSRFIIASGNGLGDFLWARDSYPIPIFSPLKNSVQLIAHDYFRFSDTGSLIGNVTGAPSVLHRPFTYVGGNLAATESGDCFIVDSSRTFRATDETLMNEFHCRKVVRFPFVKGIGDIDEVVKPLSGRLVMTSQESYVGLLNKLGYEVVMIPEPKGGALRTYVNSVVLNRTVFMPIYNEATDVEAKKVYERLGYTVVGIDSIFTSDRMMGSLHCLTMTYPEVKNQNILQQLGLHQIE